MGILTTTLPTQNTYIPPINPLTISLTIRATPRSDATSPFVRLQLISQRRLLCKRLLSRLQATPTNPLSEPLECILRRSRVLQMGNSHQVFLQDTSTTYRGRISPDYRKLRSIRRKINNVVNNSEMKTTEPHRICGTNSNSNGQLTNTKSPYAGDLNQTYEALLRFFKART